MTYLFIDIETTGLSIRNHEVWEIAYAIDDEPIKSRFVDHTPPALDSTTLPAIRLNGYVQRFEGDSFSSNVWESELRRRAEGATLVAANPHFDASFLSERWDDWGNAPWKYRMLDLEAYAMGAFGLEEPKGLAWIAEKLGVTAPTHTAADDVWTLRQCFIVLKNWYSIHLSESPALQGDPAKTLALR